MSFKDQDLFILQSKNGQFADKIVPKVSIGMPVYNGEPFIREALDSLLAQTFNDFELIISDNGSTDETEVICREYAEKDKRIRYIRQPYNQGAKANFQFVLDEAFGDYFMWAAADDIRTADCIQTYLLHIGEAGGVFTTYGIYDRENKHFSKCDVPTISDRYTTNKQLRIYFKNTITSIFYGLYKTVELKKATPLHNFDWCDSFMLIKFMSQSKLNLITTSEPKYYAGRYGSYKAKPFSGRYIKPHEYYLKALPYALRAGGFSFFYHTRPLIQSYLINLKTFREFTWQTQDKDKKL